MKITDIIIDKEFEDFLPTLQADERANLKEEIERDGFTDPLIVWQHHGELIDGYNRYRIWQELGADEDTAPDIIERQFPDRAAVMEWMFHHQIARRNLTPAQRAAVALKMKPAIEERAQANQQAAGGDKKSGKQGTKSVSTTSSKPIRPVDTRKEIAKIAKVSEDTVRKTEAVIKEGSPELVKALESGDVTANSAFKQVRKISGGTKFDPNELEDGPDRVRPPKNGSVATPTFKEEKIDKPLGVIRREMDERLKVFPATEREFRAAKHALSQFQDRWNEWKGKK